MCAFRPKISSLIRNRLIDRPTVSFFSTNEAKKIALPLGYTTTYPDFSELASLLSTLPGIKQQLSLYKQRFLAGDRICVVCHDGHLAHVSWFGVRKQLDADYELGPLRPWLLKHPSGLIYDCWTATQQRGQGLYPSVVSTLTGMLLRETPEVWIYCRAENLASKRGIEKAGFSYRGSLKSWRLFGKFLPW